MEQMGLCLTELVGLNEGRREGGREGPTDSFTIHSLTVLDRYGSRAEQD